MKIVFVLIPISLLFIGIAFFIFNWAVKSGQYDDLEGPAHSILYEDDADMIPEDARIKDNKPNVKNPKNTNDPA